MRYVGGEEFAAISVAAVEQAGAWQQAVDDAFCLVRQCNLDPITAGKVGFLATRDAAGPGTVGQLDEIAFAVGGDDLALQGLLIELVVGLVEVARDVQFFVLEPLLTQHGVAVADLGK